MSGTGNISRLLLSRHLLSAGSHSFARRQSRSYGNYADGYGSLHTLGYEGRDSVVFIPLAPFIKYFLVDPVGLSVRIQAAAKELLRRWLEKNSGLPAEERKAIGWTDLIYRYEWRDSNGKKQITVWEVSLNTFGLTRNHQLEEYPIVSEDEIKALVKTRSTVNADSRPDKTLIDSEGLGPTPGGYNKELHHFLGLLRSCEFGVLAAKTLEAEARKRKAYREAPQTEAAATAEFLSE